MSKAAVSRTHICSECRYRFDRWFGRCPDCGSWNTARPLDTGSSTVEAAIVELETAGEPARVPTSFHEFDRVLGGGMPPGATLLLAGEPGIGKSTLVLQILGRAAARGASVLLISGEEPLAQIAARAGRLDLPSPLRATEASSLEGALSALRSAPVDLVVVDSLQAMTDPGSGPTALRESAAALVEAARGSGSALIVVGHVTKDGEVAGPKAVEHLVDVVMTLEGERSGTLRLLRLSKNRFGRCDETGVFTLENNGLVAVADPSALLLADRNPGVPGCVVFPSLEGSRSVAMEIQALVGAASGQPRRVASGIAPRRLALLLAVLARRARVATASSDVFLSVVGDVAVRESGADLAICLALASAARDVPFASSCAAIGEVGLGGEVRGVPGVQRRLAEIGRLGFTHAVVPRSVDVAGSPITLLRVADVQGAIALLDGL